MHFQQVKNIVTDEIDENVVSYTDDMGIMWSVPAGHRYWDLYEQWLADGNVPLPA